MVTSIRPRSIRPVPQRPLPGGLIAALAGVRDAEEPAASDPRKAYSMKNLYPVGGDHWYGRPGFTQAGGQVASGGTCQGLYQYTKKDGTQHTVAVFAGRFYTYNWASDAWTEVLTSTHLSGASITLDSSATVYFETFADQLIVTDGVNQPWAWDGTAGGGLTLLTNAPNPAYGPPTVHGAKLFWIMANDRLTFTWSEENAPNTGYEAPGYDNAWTFGQTDQDALYRLMGTNVGLYVWRARSTTLILGAVESNFRSASTDDDVSLIVGTQAPGSVTKVGDAIFWIDANSRPQRLQIGGDIAGGGHAEYGAIWDDCRETIKAIDPVEHANLQGIYRDDLDVVLFSIEYRNRSARDRLMVFRPDGQFVGTWEGFEAFAMAMVYDETDDLLRMMHAEDDGYAYYHGVPDGTLWSDSLNAGVNAIVHEIIGPAQFWDTRYQKAFDRADLTFRVWEGITNVGISYMTATTPASTRQTLSFTGGEGGEWDAGKWDEMTWDVEGQEKHGSVGLSAESRWMRLRIHHNVADERFGFSAYDVVAYALAPWPEIS